MDSKSLPPFNATTVNQYDPTATSATTDVFTGILDEGRLTAVRDRALYDKNSLTWYPVADSNTGVLFPDAVQAKTIQESALRERPTCFKGRNQLDLSTENQDQHFNRQVHPLNSTSLWANKNKESTDFAFSGFPNPNLFYTYTDAIPTQNLQNLSHAELATALSASSVGNFQYNDYLDRLGSIMRTPNTYDISQAKTVGSTESARGAIGDNGINADPRVLEKMYSEYETSFSDIARIRVTEQSNDPRFVDPTPSVPYVSQKNSYLQEQEDQFAKINRMSGVFTGFNQPVVYKV